MKAKATASCITAAFLIAACGGGGSSPSSPSSHSTGITGGSGGATKTTPGVWQGTITSAVTGPSSLMGFTDDLGHSIWMTTDGRVWSGQMPTNGTLFDVSMSGHVYPGSHFADGTIHGTSSMHMSVANAVWSGQYSGSGDSGTFSLSMHPAWDRPASLEALAGTYTRTTSLGYTMTMSITQSGQLTANDTRGCVINGSIAVPNPTHNLYQIAATVTSCGVLDGTYQGHGTLVDATAMQNWMTSMGCFQYGQDGMAGSGHVGGGMMGSWWPNTGTNTVPSGSRNLFMFAITDGQYAMMDALAR